MNERLTARKIADALQVSQQAVSKRAKKERWPYEEVNVRGGWQRLYPFATLPRAAREDIESARELARIEAAKAELDKEFQAREAEEAATRLAVEQKEKEREAIHRRELGRTKFNRLDKSDPKRLRAKAREHVILEVGKLRHGGKVGVVDALKTFCGRVAIGQVHLPDGVQQQMPTQNGKWHLPWRTAQRWWYDYERDGIWGLTSGYGNRKGSGKIENTPALSRVLIGLKVKHPQITNKAAKDYLKSAHPVLNVVSAKTIERFYERLRDENAQMWAFIANPDAWKNIYMAAAGSVFEHIDCPNQLWELDSTPGDWLLTDGRHSVVGCIDLWSRRAKLFVSKSSTAAAVKQVLRRSMLDWGVPQAVRTDNGKDYVSEEVSGLLRDLSVIQEVCIPFASEEKGTIERFFRTMSHGVLNLLEGFIGHDVAERKTIEARKSFAQRVMQKDEVVEVQMSAAELQAKLDEWVEHYYEEAEHGGLDGRSPREQWRSWTEPLRKIFDPHALDELMAEVAGTRTIGKKGIRYDNRFYFDRDGVIFRHVEEEVTLRHDEQDLGRLAVYLDGAFLCWVEDPDVTGIDRREYAKAIKHSQRKFMAAKAAELKAFTKEIKRNPAEVIIEHRKALAANVTDLPKPAEPYTTPALEAAADAHRARLEDGCTVDTTTGEVIAHAEPTEAEIVQYEEFRSEFYAHNNEVNAVADDRRIHADWMRVAEAIERGLLVSDDERRGLEIYKQSGEWAANQRFFEEFGLSPEQFK